LSGLPAVGTAVGGTGVGATVGATLDATLEDELLATDALVGTAVGGIVGGTAAVGRVALVGSGVGVAHATTINANAISASNANFFISSPPRIEIKDWILEIYDSRFKLFNPPFRSTH
jgi:hypothetical protein